MVPAIDDARLRRLSTAAVLMREYPQALGRLERETVALAGQLYARHGGAAPIPARDWAVIDRAAHRLLLLDHALEQLGGADPTSPALARHPAPALRLIQGGRA